MAEGPPCNCSAYEKQEVLSFFTSVFDTGRTGNGCALHGAAVSFFGRPCPKILVLYKKAKNF